MTQERFQEIADLVHASEYDCWESMSDKDFAFIELFDYCLILRKQLFELTKDPGIPYKGDDDGA